VETVATPYRVAGGRSWLLATRAGRVRKWRAIEANMAVSAEIVDVAREGK